MSDAWEIVVDDRSQSVRRLTVPTGWIYQTQDGRKYNSVAGTLGRENDSGYPTWGPMVFVPKALPSLSSDEARDLKQAIEMAHSSTDSRGLDPSLTERGFRLLCILDRLMGKETR